MVLLFSAVLKTCCCYIFKNKIRPSISETLFTVVALLGMTSVKLSSQKMLLKAYLFIAYCNYFTWQCLGAALSQLSTYINLN